MIQHPPVRFSVFKEPAYDNQTLLLCSYCRPDPAGDGNECSEFLTTADISALCGMSDPECDLCHGTDSLRPVTIRNMTGHIVRLEADGTTYEFPSEGKIRCETQRRRMENLDLIGSRRRAVNGPVYFSRYERPTAPINRVTFQPDASALPPEQDRVMLIVSRAVALAHPERVDLIYPDQVITNAEGEPERCYSFGCAWGD